MGVNRKEKKAHLDGLYLVILGTLIFVLIGTALETGAPVSTVDFRVVYYGAKCLLDHYDPYSENDLKYVYHLEGGETPKDSPIVRLTETQYIYPPSAFLITLPFAFLPFVPAQILWLSLTSLCVILASFAVWEIGAGYAPVFSGAMAFLCLANSELFLILGNPAGIAIGLCVIAVWFFIKNRLAWIGIVCLSVSLMLKPHDTALVWFCLLLAGREFRKRALQALLLVIVLSVPMVLVVTHVAPHWIFELRSNLMANSARGGLSDPGPNSMAAHHIGMIISLQAILSLFRDDPSFYNPVSYLVCGILALAWAVTLLRKRLQSSAIWFALAPISALSMLPIYHRLYDAKLLLLAIPAGAMLWVRGGGIAWASLLINAFAFLATGGIPWAAFFAVLKHVKLPVTPLAQAGLIAAQVVPVPLILLTVAVFYLGVFWCISDSAGTIDARGCEIVKRERFGEEK
jgi:hypothetical protein